MDAPTMNTPAVGAEPRVEEKGREAIVSVDAGSRVRMAEKTTDHAEAPFQHPHTWSSKRKWLIVTAISCVSFVVNISLVIVAPASLAIADDLNEHSAFLLVFYITVDNLGEALAPLYIGPMSERLGRMPVVHLYNLLFIVFTLVSGFSNSVAQIVVFRFLAGASVASIALNPSIIGDLFSMEQRGSAIAIMSLIPILGTAVGPIVGGYVTQYLSWRWTFWLTAIASGCLSLALVIAMKETYVPVIRRKSIKDITSAPSKYFYGWNLKTVKAVCLLIVRPFLILSHSNVAIVMTLYLSISYGYLSLVGATMATTFQQVYGFSESSSGLIYISLTIGTLLGSVFCRFTLDYSLKNGLPGRKSSREPRTDAPTTYRAEDRLIPMIPAVVAFPAGLLIYGWGLDRAWHWIVPTLASALCGFSLSSSTAPIMSYLVDIFGDRSASAVAAALPLRYIMGAFLPVAAPYMYESMGQGWAGTFLALSILAASIVPLLVIIEPSNMGWVRRLTEKKPKDTVVRI